MYIDDTLQLDESGQGVFKRDSLLPQGLYKFYFNDNNHFDFILGADQQFSISNPDFSVEKNRISGARESEGFAAYMIFFSNLQMQGGQIREKMNSAAPLEKAELQNQLDKLSLELHNYWKQIEADYPDTFFSRFVWANFVPVLDETELPEEILQNDSIMQIRRFTFQQEHFWDNFDYTDERFLYTPFYKPKLETWFTKVLYQQYDSVRGPVFEFIEEVKSNKRIFQFVASYFLNASIQSNILGMDALFVDLAKTYYLNGQAFWVSEETLKKVRENVLFLRDNLIGNTAPDLTMQTYDGEFASLHKIDAKITAVLIFEPNCSHCKVFVPQFYKEVYLPNKKKGFEVFAIYSQDNKEEWTEFLLKHNMFDWINVWDPEHETGFKISYDARQTPRVYILDKNKKILVKRLDIEQVKKVLEFELD